MAQHVDKNGDMQTCISGIVEGKSSAPTSPEISSVFGREQWEILREIMNSGPPSFEVDKLAALSPSLPAA